MNITYDRDEAVALRARGLCDELRALVGAHPWLIAELGEWCWAPEQDDSTAASVAELLGYELEDCAPDAAEIEIGGALVYVRARVRANQPDADDAGPLRVTFGPAS